jgi:class 3 adenylate cyclase
MNLGNVVEESDGALMGDGVNIAARLESICEPGAICLSEDAYIRMLRSTRRGLETWHGRDGVTLATERASQQGTQTST